MEDINTDIDDDLALVEEMAARALEKKRMETQNLLQRMLRRIKGQDVEEKSLEEDLVALDELVASAPGGRDEHIGVQQSLKDLHDKSTEDNTDSDTE